MLLLLRPMLLVIIKAIATLLILIALYFFLAVVLTLIPSNAFYKSPEEGVDIYIKSNGVHTDLVLPVHNDLFDWRTKLDTTTFQQEKKAFEYVAIGWGDKGFYLETPTWADLKFSTAFSAMFLFTPTAMHVTYRTYAPEVGTYAKKIRISKEQYLTLVAYVQNSFQRDEKGNFLRISSYHYANANDNFYEANGRYSLFKTCNVWTNSALKEIGVKTAMWAPFDKCILHHF